MAGHDLTGAARARIAPPLPEVAAGRERPQDQWVLNFNPLETVFIRFQMLRHKAARSEAVHHTTRQRSLRSLRIGERSR
jgi:hypothetical protein